MNTILSIALLSFSINALAALPSAISLVTELTRTGQCHPTFLQNAQKRLNDDLKSWNPNKTNGTSNEDELNISSLQKLIGKELTAKEVETVLNGELTANNCLDAIAILVIYRAKDKLMGGHDKIFPRTADGFSYSEQGCQQIMDIMKKDRQLLIEEQSSACARLRKSTKQSIKQQLCQIIPWACKK